MFWFDKENPNVVFGDIRKESHILCDGRALHINPDVLMDFKNMPFLDGSFKLVVFDPPHLKHAGAKGWQAKKYGSLTVGWESEIKLGFNECMRVLSDYGVLIFKWNEQTIKVSAVLAAIGHDPLFGHRTMQNNNTIWMTFMKMPGSGAIK